MKTLLHLNTSIYSDDGESSRLAARLVNAWRAANPGARLVKRNLARDPVPHITAERFQAFSRNPRRARPRRTQSWNIRTA
jgi:FMN-dependent NADH-azoreductase